MGTVHREKKTSSEGKKEVWGRKGTGGVLCDTWDDRKGGGTNSGEMKS